MTIVTHDLIQLLVNRRFFLHRPIIVILLSKFIDSKFSVTKISFPSCNQNPQPHNTHTPTPPPPCSFKVYDENLCTVSNPVISKYEYFKTDQSSPFFSADKTKILVIRIFFSRLKPQPHTLSQIKFVRQFKMKIFETHLR